MAETRIWVRAAAPGNAPALAVPATRAKSHWGYPVEWLEHWRTELTMTPAWLPASDRRG